jgi:hypothetical protein
MCDNICVVHINVMLSTVMRWLLASQALRTELDEKSEMGSVHRFKLEAICKVVSRVLLESEAKKLWASPMCNKSDALQLIANEVGGILLTENEPFLQLEADLKKVSITASELAARLGKEHEDCWTSVERFQGVLMSPKALRRMSLVGLETVQKEPQSQEAVTKLRKTTMYAQRSAVDRSASKLFMPLVEKLSQTLGCSFSVCSISPLPIVVIFSPCFSSLIPSQARLCRLTSLVPNPRALACVGSPHSSPILARSLVSAHLRPQSSRARYQLCSVAFSLALPPASPPLLLLWDQRTCFMAAPADF